VRSQTVVISLNFGLLYKRPLSKCDWLRTIMRLYRPSCFLKEFALSLTPARSYQFWWTLGHSHRLSSTFANNIFVNSHQLSLILLSCRQLLQTLSTLTNCRLVSSIFVNLHWLLPILVNSRQLPRQLWSTLSTLVLFHPHWSALNFSCESSIF